MSPEQGLTGNYVTWHGVNWQSVVWQLCLLAKLLYIKELPGKLIHGKLNSSEESYIDFYLIIKNFVIYETIYIFRNLNFNLVVKQEIWK